MKLLPRGVCTSMHEGLINGKVTEAGALFLQLIEVAKKMLLLPLHFMGNTVLLKILIVIDTKKWSKSINHNGSLTARNSPSNKS